MRVWILEYTVPAKLKLVLVGVGQGQGQGQRQSEGHLPSANLH
jgi:hypothetical protein